jgi:DNA polymerase III subunit epsilon
MKLALFYDTETTGLPLFKEPSEDPRQPHIVSLAADLIDLDTWRTYARLDLVCKPDGWEIPDEVAAIHGYTTERAAAVGISEAVALAALYNLIRRAELRVGHSEDFDHRIVRIGMKRFCYSEEVIEAVKGMDSYCTMRNARDHCQIPGRAKGTFKNPKLSEAYEILCGKKLIGAHSSRADLDATIEVYRAIQEREGRPLGATEVGIF